MGYIDRIRDWIGDTGSSVDSDEIETERYTETSNRTFEVNITRIVDLIIHPNNGGTTIVAYDKRDSGKYQIVAGANDSRAYKCTAPSLYESFRSESVFGWKFETITEINDMSVQQRTNLGEIDATVVVDAEIEESYYYITNTEDLSDEEIRQTVFSTETGEYLDNHDDIDDVLWKKKSAYRSTVKDWRIEQKRSVRDVVKENLGQSKSMNIAAFDQPFMVPEFQVGADRQGQSDISALPSDLIQQ